MQPTRIQFDELLRRTWQIFTANFGPCALVGLVMIAILIGVWIVSMAMGFAAQASGEPVIVIAFQVFNQASVSCCRPGLAWESPTSALSSLAPAGLEISDFFAVGPFYLRGLGMTLLITPGRLSGTFLASFRVTLRPFSKV